MYCMFDMHGEYKSLIGGTDAPKLQSFGLQVLGFDINEHDALFLPYWL